MMWIHYLAYGSNLHPLRLQARIPSARLCGTIALPGHRLSFDKRGRDRSGKCTIEPSPQAVLHAAVYALRRDQRPILDRIESGYVPRRLEPVTVAGRRCRPFTYVADPIHIDSGLRPFDWYLDLVVAGARFHGFPMGYLTALQRTPTTPDLNRTRRDRHRRLVTMLAL